MDAPVTILQTLPVVLRIGPSETLTFDREPLLERSRIVGVRILTTDEFERFEPARTLFPPADLAFLELTLFDRWSRAVYNQCPAMGLYQRVNERDIYRPVNWDGADLRISQLRALAGLTRTADFVLEFSYIE